VKKAAGGKTSTATVKGSRPCSPRLQRRLKAICAGWCLSAYVVLSRAGGGLHGNTLEYEQSLRGCLSKNNQRLRLCMRSVPEEASLSWVSTNLNFCSCLCLLSTFGQTMAWYYSPQHGCQTMDYRCDNTWSWTWF
jgi:hypothetical protein